MEKLIFYIWWLLINEVVDYLAFDFLCDVTGTKKKSIYIFAWLLGNGLMITAVVSDWLPGMFFVDIVFLIVFAKGVLHIGWDKLVAPVTILFTCYTFLEGFLAIAMSWISRTVHSAAKGKVLQVLLSCFLVMMYFAGLWFIRRKYVFTLQKSISSYLYVLLLPGILIILSIRYGLRLDSPGFEEHLLGFDIGRSGYACFMMAGAVCLFFLMIEVFCKIMVITEQEKSLVLLGSQAEGQRIYIEEAKKRQEQYSSFHHDIRNHLLVLSGLIREENYEKAQEYAGKLYAGLESLSVSVSTGSEVLDVLLREKEEYARRNQIKVTCSVRIPHEFFVDDMDLCVIFANLMDNAICTCIKSEAKESFLSVSTKCKARFLVIEVVNSSSACETITMGTGLHNVKNIAEKYQGTLEIEAGEAFRVSVLLCLKER